MFSRHNVGRERRTRFLFHAANKHHSLRSLSLRRPTRRRRPHPEHASPDCSWPTATALTAPGPIADSIISGCTTGWGTLPSAFQSFIRRFCSVARIPASAFSTSPTQSIRLPSPSTTPSAQSLSICWRCRCHFLHTGPSRPASLEGLPLLRLFRRRRSFLAQPIHRSCLEKCLHELVRWRQTLRRVLRAPHRRRQPATPSLRSQESLPRPPIHPLTDTYGSFERCSQVNLLSSVTCATHICGIDRGFISGRGSSLPIAALTCSSPPGSAFRRGPLFNHQN